MKTSTHPTPESGSERKHTPEFDALPSPRVYLVYHDSDEGKSKHVIAKNRKEAGRMVDFPYTNIAWRPWIKLIEGKFLDEWGKEYE